VLNNLIGGFILAGYPVHHFFGEPVMFYWGMTVCGLILIGMIKNMLPEAVEEPVRVEPVFVWEMNDA
jgi:hypothetical protein